MFSIVRQSLEKAPNRAIENMFITPSARAVLAAYLTLLLSNLESCPTQQVGWLDEDVLHQNLLGRVAAVERRGSLC